MVNVVEANRFEFVPVVVEGEQFADGQGAVVRPVLLERVEGQQPVILPSLIEEDELRRRGSFLSFLIVLVRRLRFSRGICLDGGVFRFWRIRDDQGW